MRFYPLAIGLTVVTSVTVNAQNTKPHSQYSIHVESQAGKPKPAMIVNEPSTGTAIASSEPRRIIVRLISSPRSNPMSRSTTNIDAEHRQFLSDLAELHRRSSQARASSTPPKILYEYRRAFNGFALEVPTHMVDEIRLLDGVARVTEDKRVTADDNTSNAIIKAPDAWADFGVTGQGIRIGIIDTGIDYTHPDLGGGFGTGFKVEGGYDFFNDDNDPMDDHGHGTHVASIAAGNGTSLKGVAPEATLYAYKVLGADGFGFDSQILAAIERTLDPDNNPDTDDALDVVNMSLGRVPDATEPLSEAVDNAVAHGVVYVVAAGNSYDYLTIQTPGIAEKAVTVGATDSYNTTAYFSSKGPAAGSLRLKPDVAAPGVGILGAFLDHGYSSLDGTSMASPHVAGAAALILEKFPEWAPETVKAALMGTAAETGTTAIEQGAGVINVHRAMSAGFVLEPGEVSLGALDNSVSTPAWERTLTIRNYGDLTRKFDLSVEGLSVAGIDVTLDPSSVEVAAGGDAHVTVMISVNTAVIEPKAVPEGYIWQVVATSGATSVKSMFSLFNPIVTTLNFVGELPNNVLVIGVEGSWYWQPFYPESNKLHLTLPVAKYDIIAQYDWSERLVILEGIEANAPQVIALEKTMADNLIVFRPIDRNGNPLYPPGHPWGSVIFTGVDKNIMTFYPWPQDTLYVSDQATYRFDFEIRGQVDPAADDYYAINLSTPPGFSESATYSNDPEEFYELTITNPGVADGKFQEVTHFVQSGYPNTYFRSWNPSPFLQPKNLKIHVSASDPASRFMGFFQQLSPQSDAPGYKWETDHIDVQNGKFLFTTTMEDTLGIVEGPDFHHVLGTSIPSFNAFTYNYNGKIEIVAWPGTGLFKRTYGEREKGTVSYTLQHGESLVSEGLLSNGFMENEYMSTGFYLEVPDDEYIATFKYSDFQVGGKFGNAEAVLEFDTRNWNDANAPSLRYLALEVDGISTDRISTTAAAVIKVKPYDNCGNSHLYYTYCNSSGVKSTSLFLRQEGVENWKSIELYEDSDGMLSTMPLEELTEGFYSLRVVVTDMDDNRLTYTVEPAFVVGPPNEEPYVVVTLLAPKNGSAFGGIDPLFTWTSIEGVSIYELQLSTNQNFSENLVIVESDTTHAYSTAQLTDGVTYYWRVRPLVGETPGRWSETFAFAAGFPERATLLEPANGATEIVNPVTLKWINPPSSSWRQLEVSLYEDFRYYDAYWPEGNSYTLTDLYAGSTYYWRVRSYYYSVDDTYLADSEVFQFNTTGENTRLATLISPENNAIDQPVDVEFTWSYAQDWVSQYFEISTDSLFMDVVFYDWPTGTKQTVPSLKNGTRYYWRITTQHYDAPNNVPTRTFTFATESSGPKAAVLLEPADNAVDQTIPVKLKWTPSQGAQSEVLEISETSDFSQVVFFEETTKNQLSVSNNLQFGKTYYWRITSKYNQDPFSLTSSSSRFTTEDILTAAEESTSQALSHYPNPFCDRITIEFHHPVEDKGVLLVLDAFGREVARISFVAKAGENSLLWDGRNAAHELLADGIYLLRLKVGQASPRHVRALLQRNPCSQR